MRREEVQNLDDLLTMLVFHSNDLAAIEKDLYDTVLPILEEVEPKLSVTAARSTTMRAKNELDNLINEIKSLPKE